MRPGDLSPGDLLPTGPDDPRLVPGYVASDDPAVEEVAFELGLGRERVLSREGRLDAAERWHEPATAVPDTPMARSAPAHCGTCGFWLPLAGSLRAGSACAATRSPTPTARSSASSTAAARTPRSKVEVPRCDDAGVVYDDGEDVTRPPMVVVIGRVRLPIRTHDQRSAWLGRIKSPRQPSRPGMSTARRGDGARPSQP